MSIIEIERDDTVAIIKMTNGENRHNKAFSEALNQAVDQVVKDETATALILTSTDEKNWSQGIDLDWMMKQLQGGGDPTNVRDFLLDMDQIFRKFLLYPIPVIAAINGHCFANGAILAAACDFRLMRSDRGFYCLPEVNINIPFAPAMQKMLLHKYPNTVVNQMMLTGKRFTAPELERHNIIEKACADMDETIKASILFAKSLVKNRDIYSKMKKQLNADVVDTIDNVNPEYFASQSIL